MRKSIYLAAIILVLGGGAFLAWAPATAEKPAEDARVAINAVMDGFHDAAARADGPRYLGYFAPDGVFMGTDDWERWPLEPDFRRYVAERFAAGKGWVYVPRDRHIALSLDGRVAWFDEITESEKWGLFRGTGVLLKQEAGWKIAHYSMSVLVPNEAWVAVSELTRAAVKARDAKPD